MTTTIDAAPAMTYRGRSALVDSGASLVQVAAITDEAVITTDGGQHPLGAATILPRGGECITGPGIARTAPWRWLGLVKAEQPREPSSVLSGWVLGPDGFPVTRAFVASEVDARTSVVAGCTHAEPVLAGALVAVAVRRESTGAYYRQRQQDQQEALVASAHRWADDHDADTSFDEFLNECGLPGREREFDLRVQVSTTVFLAQSGTSLDQAIEAVATADVLDRLDLDGSDYEVEEDTY